nr:TniQ family protein [Gloeotrichia echinulata DEX184]
MEKPLTPKHSRLFHLEPIGVGTFYVESLTSYIARLAEAHSVLPGALLALEVKPLIKNAVYLLTQNLCPLL